MFLLLIKAIDKAVVVGNFSILFKALVVYVIFQSLSTGGRFFCAT
jgi:hypothetical protein